MDEQTSNKQTDLVLPSGYLFEKVYDTLGLEDGMALGETKAFKLIDKVARTVRKGLYLLNPDKETYWMYKNPQEAARQWRDHLNNESTSFPCEMNGWTEIDDKGGDVKYQSLEKEFDPSDIEGSAKSITNYFLKYPLNRGKLKAYVNELNKKGKLKQNEINFEKTMLNFEKMFGNLFEFGKGNEVMKYPIDSPNNPRYEEEQENHRRKFKFDYSKLEKSSSLGSSPSPSKGNKDKEFSPAKIPFGEDSISGIASYFCKNPKDRAALKSHVDEMRQKGLLSQAEITNLKNMRNYSQIDGHLFD